MNSVLTAVKVPVITTVAILLTIFIFTKIFGPIPFSVNSVTTTKSDLFTVDGVGEATGVPSTAQFTVGVTQTATTVDGAQETVNTTTNKIVEALKALKIEEENIKTTNYNITPNTDFSSPTQRTTGYTVSVSIEVKLDDAEQADKALSAATTAGANVVNGVTFVLSDEERDELEKEARKDAIADAKEKAKSISGEAGIRLGKVMNIYVSQDGGVMPYAKAVMNEAQDAVGSATPVDLQPGENVVKINVSLSYETL